MTASYQKIDSLTGLRAFAALWVVLHNMSHYPGIDPGFMQDFSWGITTGSLFFGYQGVDIFFFLSGFVIAYVYQNNFIHGLDRGEIKRYYALRLGRIYPLHLTILIGILVMASRDIFPYGENITLAPAFLNLTLMDSWGIFDKGSWNYAAWSLSAEWFAYLLFPFLTFVIIGERSAKGYFILLVIISIIFATLSAQCCATTDIDNGVGSLVRVTFGFTAGCILYNLFRLEVGKKLPWDVIGILAFLGLFMTHYHFIDNIDVANAISYVWIALLLYALAQAKNILKWCFANPVSRYFGEISFAIFLLHAPFMMLCADMFESEIGVLIEADHAAQMKMLLQLLGGLCVCAALCYHLIERPCRNYVKRKLNQPVK